MENLQHRAEDGDRFGLNTRLWFGMHRAMRRGMDKPLRDFRPRAFLLAQAVFRLYPKLAAASPAYRHLAHQLLRSVTAIGALLEEGAVASSRRDMAAKYVIALREAREGNYWARLGQTEGRWIIELSPVEQETDEFVAMLTTAVRKLKKPSDF